MSVSPLCRALLLLAPPAVVVAAFMLGVFSVRPPPAVPVGARPLSLQFVHPNDSVLGPVSRAPAAIAMITISTPYVPRGVHFTSRAARAPEAPPPKSA